MSQQIVEQVSREHPELLQQNTGSACYQHTVFLIQRFRALGHSAHLICKTQGEGQYTPPGFVPFDTVGFDGKGYRITGVSHDAIYLDGLQYDTLGSANEHERPIYRIPGSIDVSFDPATGPQIRAFPVWNPIPKAVWRAWNPPLLVDGIPSAPPPAPQPEPSRPPVMSKGEAYAELQALNAFYAAPEGLQRPGGMVRFDDQGRPVADVEALAQWFHQLAIERVPRNVVYAQIRNSDEWKSKHPGETP